MFHVFMNDALEGVLVDIQDPSELAKVATLGLTDMGQVDTPVEGLAYILGVGGRTMVKGKKVDGAKGDAMATLNPCIEVSPALYPVRIVNTN